MIDSEILSFCPFSTFAFIYVFVRVVPKMIELKGTVYTVQHWRNSNNGFEVIFFIDKKIMNVFKVGLSFCTQLDEY